MWLNNTPWCALCALCVCICVCVKSSLSIHLLMNTQADFIGFIVSSVSMNRCMKISLLYLTLSPPCFYSRLVKQDHLIIYLFYISTWSDMFHYYISFKQNLPLLFSFQPSSPPSSISPLYHSTPVAFLMLFMLYSYLNTSGSPLSPGLLSRVQNLYTLLYPLFKYI